MDLMASMALRRAADALKMAAAAPEPRRDDDRHVADLVRALVARERIPAAAQREHDALGEQGHVAEHGGVLVPFGRIFGPQFRDLVSGTGTGTSMGGNLIGVQVGPYVPELLGIPSVLRAGATVIGNLTSDVKLPIQATSVEAEWVPDEVTGPTEAAPTFSSVALSPKTATAFVDIGRRLRLQAATDVEALMRAHLQRAVSRAIDTAALVGTGADGQPRGLTNTSGVNSYGIATSGGALTRAHLKGIVAAVAADNGLQPESRAAFLVNTATALSCYATETSSGSGRYLYEPTSASTGTLGGWPAFLNGALPADGTKGGGSSLSTVCFGDWTQLYVGLFGGGVELLANPAALSLTGGTRLHIYVSCDVAVAQPGAFTVCSDVVTS